MDISLKVGCHNAWWICIAEWIVIVLHDGYHQIVDIELLYER